ncbi:MAG: AraC family ligand binding domain-containing protein [Giesbergeria sp.]
MHTAAEHRSHVLATPWTGAFCTRTESARQFGRHSHAVFGVGLVEAGAQSSASARGTVQAYAGDIITSNPGEVHDGKPLGSATRRWHMLYLEPELLDTHAADYAQSGKAGTPRLVLTRPVLHDLPLARALQELLARIARWNQQPGDVQRLACDEAFTRASTRLVQYASNAAASAPQAASPAMPHPAIAQIRDWLADAPLAPPSLAEMAAFAGLSRTQLLRRFSQAYGLPPHAWLLQQRAERARSLISQGTGLAQAAHESGFADQSHMTRIFARHFGFAPGALQRGRPGHRTPPQ